MYIGFESAMLAHRETNISKFGDYIEIPKFEGLRLIILKNIVKYENNSQKICICEKKVLLLQQILNFTYS